MLYGRDEERARLGSALDAARAGNASSLLVRGGAGMGKSALLEDTAEQAQDARVLRTVGLQSESALAFAALHRLLHPVLPGVTGLAPPQRQALEVAFGERHDVRIDPFLVALATLSTLTELAEDRPVVCLVDDLQWLDAASADALLFAARRLLAERVVMVFAARDDHPGFVPPTDVPELVLRGLGAEEIRTLVEARTGQAPPAEVVESLARRTDGNPLALVELPAQLSSLQLSGASALPPDLPLPARVERVFIERCRRLSTQGQTLMLLAAADDAVSLSVLQRAGEELGVPPATIDEVEAAGLLSTRGDVASVRHPLVRSAVYQAATSLERRTAHRALARALAGGDQPDRHAWHRAAAADGPDEEVARLLQAVAEGAERRGGRDAASRAYERAAQLSPDDRDAAARLLGAARTAYGAGQVDRASGLLAASRAIADERVLRADIDRLRCRIEVVAGSAVDAHRIFVASAREVAAEDPARAVEMAAMAGVLRCHAVDSGTRLPDGLLVVEPSADDPLRLQCLKLLVEATERDAAGDPAEALVALGRAVPIGLAAEDRDVLGNLGNVALHLGDATTHRTLFTSMLASARAESSVMEVLYALNRLVISQFATGQWVAAHRSVEESASLARSIGQPSLTTIPEAWEAVLAAHEGADDVESRLAEATSAAARHRLGVMDAPVADLLRWARAVSATRDGDAAASVHHFAQMEVPVLTRLATSARILAAVQAGDDARAEAWTREVEGFADATRSPWALAAALLGRALLAEPDAAPDLYTGALAEHDRAGRPYEAACARLAFGEHLRRLGRRVEARGHLKEALETFRDLGAAPLVDRAARELRASGETARKRDPSTLTQLTPTELNIATLVSGGLTNKEVAEQCWISPRTVAFHLRNVFTKTGVTSRAQLAQLGLG